MPPKKEAAAPKPLLGRPSNNLKVGIVGLPNVGKSTLFNTLTNSAVAAENYPFCTIDPSEARVAVPDERFEKLCDMYKPASKVPAYLTVIDIAGLVKGAASGAGLGNAFLSNIKAVDAIFHVVRGFGGEDIVHVEGDVDPVRDLDIISTELRLKDEEWLQKQVSGLEKEVIRGGSTVDKNKKFEFEVMSKCLQMVKDEKKDVRFGNWNAKEIEVLNSFQLLTAKSVVFLVNLNPEDYIKKKSKWLPKIKAWVDEKCPGDPIIPFSCALEAELSTLTEADRSAKLKELGTTSVLSKIVVTGYKALQLIYFFTAGPDEVRAWTIRLGTKAPQAAGVIHTDFEKGFIMAEVMKYEELMELGSESAVKAAGKYYMKGKEYSVDDGDIIFFKFNVTAAPKKK